MQYHYRHEVQNDGNIYTEAKIAVKWFKIDFNLLRQSCHINEVKDKEKCSNNDFKE